MKINKLLSITTLLCLGATAVFAGPTCDINNITTSVACTAQVSIIANNNVPFTLVNVTPNKTYDCNITVEGHNAQQVVAQNLQGENGASVSPQSSYHFNVGNNTTAIGMVTFTMHNGRQSFWKKESNTVYVVCSQTAA